MRRLKLFFEVCLVSGLSILLFSVAGSRLIRTNGLFIGAIIGGILGIIISCRLAVYFLLTNKDSFSSILLFSMFGFVLSILISTFNFNHPIIVVLSTSLI